MCEPARRPPQPDFLYAEFPLRTLAFAIDFVLASVAVVVLAEVCGWIIRGPGFGRFIEWDLVTAVVLLLAAVVSVLPTAVAAYLWRAHGATPGQRLFGLRVVRRTTGERLTALSAFSRWVLLYAPLTLLWAYPRVVSVAFDPESFLDLLILVRLPWLPFVAMGLPLAWYALLGASALADRRRGRGLHDRICGSIVVRRRTPATPRI